MPLRLRGFSAELHFPDAHGIVLSGRFCHQRLKMAKAEGTLESRVAFAWGTRLSDTFSGFQSMAGLEELMEGFSQEE